MSTQTPDVAVVVETENEQEGHRIRLAEVLEAWKWQTSAARIRELLFVSARNAAIEEAVRAMGFAVRWIQQPAARYYEQKNAGALASTTPYVAFADADVRPDPDWLERGLARLAAAPPQVAGLTGHTRYPTGPFTPEMALAQWPHLAQARGETHGILAHNLLMRVEPLRRAQFGAAHIRHGGDTLLVEALRACGYRVLYEPEMRMTHNYARGLGELWTHCVALGWNYATMEGHLGTRRAGPLRNGIGRYRVLARQLFADGRHFGIGPARYPLSLTFFAWYCTAIGRGYAMGLRGEPEPSAAF